MKEEQPLVSILTLTYNHQKYIGDCVRSVQAQTYQNWEMLIVDDGSTDDTFSIIGELAENDKRIKVFTQENVGVLRMKESYDLALENSNGKYIAILDGDDIWLPEKLMWQIPLLERNEKAVVCFGQAYTSSADLSKDISLAPKANEYDKYSYLAKQELKKHAMASLTIVIRRKTLEDIGGFKQSHDLPLVDYPTILELSLKGMFAFVGQPLGKWRNSVTQTSKSTTTSLEEKTYRLALDFYQTHNEHPLLMGLTENEIHKSHKFELVGSYSRMGRYKLIRKEFKSARKDFAKSLFCFGFYNFPYKLKSMLGILFSYAKQDMEGFLHKFGGVSYK